jgi:hypothetical protein
MRMFRSAAGRSLAAAAVVAALAVPRAAHAYVFFGVGGYPFFFGPPFFGPAFYPPPVVYAPPPVFYPPPGPYAAPYAAPAAASGPRCVAGLYICPVDRPGPVGAPCSCPSEHGRQPGTVR